MSNEAESEILQPSFVIHHHKLQYFLPRLKRQIQSTGEGGAKEVKVKSMPYQFENLNEDDTCVAVEADKCQTTSSRMYSGNRSLPGENHTLSNIIFLKNRDISHISASHSNGKFAMICRSLTGVVDVTAYIMLLNML